MAAVSAGVHAGEVDLEKAVNIMEAVGKAVVVPERYQDAVTAISGSGPAYLFFVVEAMIDAIEAAIARYPHADEYRSYPGPNSNTFLAHIGREVPALRLDLPANAIGKDYRPVTRPLGVSPSGSGLQFSLLGLFGLSVGLEEGLELNLLGLNFGVDLNSPALRLPAIGRVGLDDAVVSEHGAAPAR